jgi:cystathionine beta-synthase
LDSNIKIIAIDPEGSILAQPESINGPGPEKGQQIEGIGYDFIPRVLDRTHTDHWMKGPDKESYIMARRLLREEGMMAGGSSGTALHAAVTYIKEHKIGKDKRCVVLCPDNIRNYMTKHLNLDWMYERGYITEQECVSGNLSDVVPADGWGLDVCVESMELNKAVFLAADTPVDEVLHKF